MKQLSIGPYPGGKCHLALTYAEILPYKGIKTYIEGFGGMGNVLLNKAKHEKEYYNDIFMPVVNIFKCLCNPSMAEKLIARVLETEYSKKEFMAAKNSYREVTDLVESAVLTLVLLKQSKNGSLRDLNWRGFYEGGESERYINSFYGLYDVAERLNGVNILSRDVNELLREHKEDDSICWFLDPPYNLAERSGKLYVEELASEKEQKAFLDEVKNIRGKAVICGYKEKSTLYDEILSPDLGWQSFIIGEVSKTMQMKGIGESKDKAYEWVWVNYQI